MGEYDDLIAAAGSQVPAAPAGGADDYGDLIAAAGGPTPEPSMWERAKNRVSSSFSNLGNTLKSGAGAAYEGLRHPIDTITDPSRRHEFERGLSDVVTFGLAQKAGEGAEKLGNYLGVPKEINPDFASEAPLEAEAAPGFRAAGNIGGMFLPSPASLAAARVAKVIPGTGMLANAARTTAAYEATAVPAAAIQAPSGHRAEAAFDAATDPAGLAVGLGASMGSDLLARAGGRVADRIAETPGAKARRIIEERGQGAKVSLTSAGKGGVFDRELAGVGTDDRAIGTAAERGAERLVEQIKEDHAVETSRPFKKLKEQIDNSPAARNMRDVTPIVTHMQNAVDDLETPPFVRAALTEQLKLLDKHRTGIPDPNTGVKDGPVLLPERQLNGLRKELMRQAKVGRSDAPGAAEAPLRTAAFEAKKMVDDGPYAMLNDFFARGAKETENRRKLLGLKAKPAADEQVDINKARLGLQRGEEMANSNTAGAMADRIAKLRAENPSYQTAIDLPSLARARNDLSFHLAPGHGGLMGRAGGEALAVPLTAYGMVTHPLATSAALGAANLKPIQGRVLAPLAERLRNAPSGANSAAIARLIFAAREPGITRAALQAQAEKDGIQPEIAANIAAQNGL